MRLTRPAAAGRPLRAVVGGLTAAVLLLPAFAAGARAASAFYIRGAGDGHGIGMSQYGAYGYALHGADYRFILAHYYQGTTLQTTDPQRIVRVLLATGAAKFSGATKISGSSGPILRAASTYSVTARSGTLQLATADGHIVGSFPAPLSVSGPAPLTVPGLGAYRGSLQFYPGGGGVQTINAVGLDDYVRGVVPAEMPSGWAPAALEAQAVAARTYAITGTVGAADYDLYSDTRSQMYGGVAVETAVTNSAVAATSGQIVTYDGRPATTYFFASSGGYTESIQNVWAGATPDPWLRGVPDPYDDAGGNPYHSWGSQMSVAAAAARLGDLVKGSLLGIQVNRHGVSPRIVQAQVVGTGGRSAVTGTQLQAVLGLDSTYAAFTTISTHDSKDGLSGTIFPSPGRGSVSVEVDRVGGWRVVAHAPITAAGGYGAAVGAGRYWIVDGSLDGPAVMVP